MTLHAPLHGVFTIERDYPATPARVFRAWSEPAQKARWFIGPPGYTETRRIMDFRVGGEDILEGAFPNGGPRTFYRARYHDIQPDARIVAVYDMHVGGVFMSVSLTTVTFEATRAGTRMIFTEQAVYIDGKDGTESRRNGVGTHLDNLGAMLREQAAAE